MNRTSQIIKETLTMKEVAERYGFEINRSGYINCPFHAGDHDASLKIYPGKGGGFFCFGCRANGSVIDFTMRLFECSFKEAVGRLNDDFNLGLGMRSYREKKAARSAFMAAQRAIKERQERAQKAEEEYWVAFDRWCAADRIKRENDPSSDEWAEAVKSLPQLYYELTLAEERRREFDITSRNSGMEQG